MPFGSWEGERKRDSCYHSVVEDKQPPYVWLWSCFNLYHLKHNRAWNACVELANKEVMLEWLHMNATTNICWCSQWSWEYTFGGVCVPCIHLLARRVTIRPELLEVVRDWPCIYLHARRVTIRPELLEVLRDWPCIACQESYHKTWVVRGPERLTLYCMPGELP